MNITFLTGAGISVPSGIPDYRSQLGLWNSNDPEKVSSLDALLNDPKEVSKFFKDLYRKYENCKPNLAHEAISNLQNRHEVFIITQNVDDLHEKAGSKNVHHFHGNMSEWIHLDTNVKVNINDVENFDLYRPNVVLFGEVPHGNMNEMVDKIKKSDYFIVVGTSMLVYPSSSLYKFTNPNCKKVYISKKIFSPIVNKQNFQEIYEENAAKFLPKYLKNLI